MQHSGANSPDDIIIDNVNTQLIAQIIPPNLTNPPVSSGLTKIDATEPQESSIEETAEDLAENTNPTKNDAIDLQNATSVTTIDATDFQESPIATVEVPVENINRTATTGSEKCIPTEIIATDPQSAISGTQIEAADQQESLIEAMADDPAENTNPTKNDASDRQNATSCTEKFTAVEIEAAVPQELSIETTADKPTEVKNPMATIGLRGKALVLGMGSYQDYPALAEALKLAELTYKKFIRTAYNGATPTMALKAIISAADRIADPEVKIQLQLVADKYKHTIADAMRDHMLQLVLPRSDRFKYIHTSIVNNVSYDLRLAQRNADVKPAVLVILTPRQALDIALFFAKEIFIIYSNAYLLLPSDHPPQVHEAIARLGNDQYYSEDPAVNGLFPIVAREYQYVLDSGYSPRRPDVFLSGLLKLPCFTAEVLQRVPAIVERRMTLELANEEPSAVKFKKSELPELSLLLIKRNW